jgi:hypothetical protein
MPPKNLDPRNNDRGTPDHGVKRLECLLPTVPLDPLYKEFEIGLDRGDIDVLGISSWHGSVVIVWHVGSRQSRGCEASASRGDAASPRSIAKCHLPNPQQELLDLARRYERRADHMDRNAAFISAKFRTSHR